MGLNSISGRKFCMIWDSVWLMYICAVQGCGVYNVTLQELNWFMFNCHLFFQSFEGNKENKLLKKNKKKTITLIKRKPK